MNFKIRKYTAVVFLLIAAAYVGLANHSIQPKTARAAASGSRVAAVAKEPGVGEVHGTVYASLDPQSRQITVLPDVSLYLKDEETGAETDAVLSDVNGRFVIAQKPGRYRLYWRGPGWLPDYKASPIQISAGQVAFTGLTRIYPDIGADGSGAGLGIIAGRLLFADGSPCQFSNEFFAVNESGWVTIVGRKGRPLSQRVRANRLGEYVLAGLPQGRLRVRGECGKTSTEQWVTVGAESRTSPQSVDLIIPNHRPKVMGMTAAVDGNKVTTVLPGTRVRISIDPRDDDRDPLQITWAVPSGAGRVASSHGETAEWIAPSSPGIYPIYALVSDGRGGYSQGTINLRVGQGKGEDAPAFSQWQTSAIGMQQEPPVLDLPDGVPPFSGYPTSSPFLHYLRDGSSQQAIEYYVKVDPRGRRTFLDPQNPDPANTRTLADWWDVNGFATDGSKPVRTAYLNNNDLGFGRDMHCLQKENGDIACYVTNYGGPDQNPANADLAWEADPTNAVATVCMEYSPVESVNQGTSPPPRVVKFFVYNGGDGTGHLRLSANLDGARSDGEKFVPQLCVVCHGGFYQGVADMHATFREFDLASFRYSALPGASQAEQEPAFKLQNEMVAAVAARDAPGVADLIRGWYAGGDIQDPTFVPDGWSAHPDLYLNVVARSCRTCHAAQQGLSWLTYRQFATFRTDIGQVVCGPNKIMPNSFITYKNFWLSENPHSPTFLAQFEAPDWRMIGACQ